jgi:anti-repressor protein
LTDAATLQRLLLGMTGKALATEERLAELEPQAAALDQLTDAHGALAVTHAAKAMGVKPGKLFHWLEANGWMYRGADGLIGYQTKVDQGLIEHKVHRHDRGPDRPAKLINRALLTAKGVARLTELRAGA